MEHHRARSEETGAMAYHATSRDALESIRDLGLLPNDGTRGFWPEGYEVADRLFFCTTIEGADYYAYAISRNVGEPAVLRFPLPDRRTHDVRTDSGDGWYVHEPVPASAIEVLCDDSWKLLSDMV